MGWMNGWKMINWDWHQPTNQPWWQPTHEVGWELHHIHIHSFIQLTDFLADVSMDFSSFNMALSITKLAIRSPLCLLLWGLFYNALGLGLDHDGWANGWTIGCDNKFSFGSLDEWQDMMTLLPLWKKKWIKLLDILMAIFPSEMWIIGKIWWQYSFLKCG